jgi:GNAT superfamily N-acetyltransferase
VPQHKIEIVPATSQHLLEIQDLWHAIAQESEPNDENASAHAVQGLNQSMQRFDFFASDAFWLLLARLDGKPVGYLTAVRIPKADDRIGVLYIDELYVVQAYRRLGIGSALVKGACSIGQELGYWRVRLNADPNDPRVHAFYRASGFSDDGHGFFQKQIHQFLEE